VSHARERELAWLEEAVVPGSVVAIVGPPGMGTSWLAHTFATRRRAAGALVPDVFDGALTLASATLRLHAGDRPAPGAAWLLATSAPIVGASADLVLGPLSELEAARIFVEGAELQWPRDRGVGDRISRTLGREPWAIVAAAQLAKSAGLSALEKRLSDSGARFLDPMREVLEAQRDALAPDEREVLLWAAAARGPVTFDILEAVVEEARVPDVLAAVLALLGRGLFRRGSRHGVVWFAPTWAVGEVLRSTASDLAHRRAGVRVAWAERARELASLAYGPDASRVLTELGAAIPDAEAWVVEEPSAAAAGLFVGLTDAIFFDGAQEDPSAPFAGGRSPAFAAAVASADAASDDLLAARTRSAASRARLEEGEPDVALDLADAARQWSTSTDDASLLGECERRRGWALMALGRAAEAAEAFEAARALAESTSDLRGEADALAGGGMLALLAGDPGKAEAALRSSLAIHEVAQDAPRAAAVRGMMELLPTRGAPTEEELSARRTSLQADLTRARAGGVRMREALALAKLALLSRAHGTTEEAARLEAEARVALRLVGPAVSPQLPDYGVTPEGPRPYRLGPLGETLTLPDGATHSLTRHGALKRVLWALALRHRDRPGVPHSMAELVEAGWPGEKMKYEAASLRVYTTIRRLRKLGLESVLLTRDDGYLLDSAAEFALDAGA